jgi:hypothetical protein
MGFGTQQGFPNVSAPLVNRKGEIEQAWLQLLIQLWNRTGGAQGINSADILIQQIINETEPNVTNNDTTSLQLPFPSGISSESFSDEDKLFALMLFGGLGSQTNEMVSTNSSWIPLVSGSYISAYTTEQPVFITDGAGQLILITGP